MSTNTYKFYIFLRYISLRIVQFKEILGHHSLSTIETSIKAFKFEKNININLKTKEILFKQNLLELEIFYIKYLNNIQINKFK